MRAVATRRNNGSSFYRLLLLSCRPQWRHRFEEFLRCGRSDSEARRTRKWQRLARRRDPNELSAAFRTAPLPATQRGGKTTEPESGARVERRSNRGAGVEIRGGRGAPPTDILLLIFGRRRARRCCERRESTATERRRYRATRAASPDAFGSASAVCCTAGADRHGKTENRHAP